jgi:hypothetical protein
MSLRSKGALLAMPVAGWDNASATTLDVPGTNTRLLVYSQVALLAGRGRRRYHVKGKNQRFMVCPKLEGSAVKTGAGCLIPETAARSFLSKLE